MPRQTPRSYSHPRERDTNEDGRTGSMYVGVSVLVLLVARQDYNTLGEAHLVYVSGLCPVGPVACPDDEQMKKHTLSCGVEMAF